MNYIAERRLEEKERRRTEILDAAEHVAAAVGWEDMTMDQVARRARLSRALLYVYFKDKNDLMFGIDERALLLLKKRFEEVSQTRKRGIDQIEGFGRAYVTMSQEFPVYFDVLSRCEFVNLEEMDPESNVGLCLACGDAVFELMGQALETGIKDGSIRKDIGQPTMVAISLWGFMHGVMQIATNKATVLTHRGVETTALMEQALELSLRSLRA